MKCSSVARSGTSSRPDYATAGPSSRRRRRGPWTPGGSTRRRGRGSEGSDCEAGVEDAEAVSSSRPGAAPVCKSKIVRKVVCTFSEKKKEVLVFCFCHQWKEFPGPNVSGE